MNATPAVSQAPITTDPSEARGATSVDSARSGANSRDFASALSDAGRKPARKPATGKAHDGGPAGGPLPVPGNPSPPPPPPAAPANATASSAAAAPAGGVAGTQGVAPGATMIPGASDAATGAGAAGTGAAFAQVRGLPGAMGAVSDPVGLAKGPALPAGEDGTLGNDPPAAGAAAGAAAAALTRPVPGTTPTRQPKPTVGSALGASSVAARARGAAASAVKSLTAADDATTQPDATDATASTGAAAQIPDAAALAVAGAMAPSDPGVADAALASAKSTDDSTVPAPGGMTQDAGDTNGLPVRPLAVAAAAGTLASERGIAALAAAGATDKHSQSGNGGSLLADGSGNATAGAALTNATAPTAVDANSMPTMKVAAGVETPEFAQGIADRVSWMVDSNLNGAKLQVNPPQLGPIEVRITVQGENAQIWMSSHSAVTRDALEASSPKLREMLGAQGFGQVSVDISQRSFQERPSQPQPYDWTPSANRGAAAPSLQVTAATARRISIGAVDAYA